MALKVKDMSLDYITPLEDDENTELPIINEKDCKVLNKREFSSISSNGDLICIFDKEKFIEAFSEITRSRPITLKVGPDKSIDTEYIIFKGMSHTIVLDKFEKGRLSLEYSTPENVNYEVNFVVHPIRRNVSVINNRTLKEEYVDIMNLIQNDKNFVGADKVLERVGNAMQKEWDKLHKEKRVVYIR